MIGAPAATGEARFLAALRHEQPDATPVWFMRQAGRCLAEYRRLRERYDILTLAKTPELCARVTAMPVDAFGVDAAVLFADIMLPPSPHEAWFVSAAHGPDELEATLRAAQHAFEVAR